MLVEQEHKVEQYENISPGDLAILQVSLKRMKYGGKNICVLSLLISFCLFLWYVFQKLVPIDGISVQETIILERAQAVEEVRLALCYKHDSLLTIS